MERLRTNDGVVKGLSRMKVEGAEERFIDFFRSFETETEELKYRTRLSQMAVSSQRSLVIDFEDLISYDSVLARELVEKPDEFLDYANRAVYNQMKIEDPEYAEQTRKFFARFRSLPDKFSLRKIGSDQIGRLLNIDGILVRATSVKPFLIRASFQCRQCGAITHVDQTGITMRGPGLCPHCKGRSKGKLFDLIEKQSLFINFQEVRMQEKPEELPPGQLPRAMDAKMNEDLVDKARPGDRVSVTGVIRAQQELTARRGRLRTFELYADVNYVDVSGREAEFLEISPEDERAIKGIARDPWANRKLLKSVAPSIYGYDDIKEAILYLLFGGVQKQLPDGITIRGEANVLLIGDPGIAKSQLLQYVARIAPRGIYTSGRGSTAAGLTAAVLRDKTGGMVLEAGALVLADKGVCAVDEIEKMRPEDRIAIHESLEQNTVSIAKGGIVATLNARASVLAAANPALGRYDPYRNVSENITLPITLLSRFDLIFVMRDIPEPEKDAKMSEHILALHKFKSTPEEAPLSPELFKKYISYAKRIDPKLSDDAITELRDFYMKMRSASGSTESPITITPRQLEALIRLAEARARALLRDSVTVDDARAIIRLMNVSLQNVGIDTTTGKMDIDVLMTGKPKSLRDKMHAVLTTVAEMERETGIVEEAELYDKLSKKLDINEGEAKGIVWQLVKEGLLYSPRPGQLKRTAT